MHLVDPLKQPQRFIQQADALVRQSFAEPSGVDPFAQIDAHLEASFASVLAGMAGAPEQAEPPANPAPMPMTYKPAGGPVSSPGTAMGMNNGPLPIISGHAPSAAWPVAGLGIPGGPAGMAALPGWPPGAGAPLGAQLEPMIAQASAKHGVPDWLVRNVIRAESAGNPAARSPVGAMGLMQLMPGTAADLGVSDPYDAAQNVDGGTRYLRQLLDRFGGDVTKAVAGYNAGPGAVEQHHGVPPFAETQAYVKRVLGSH